MALPFDNGVGGSSAPLYLNTSTSLGTDDQGRTVTVHTLKVEGTSGSGSSSSQTQGAASDNAASVGNAVQMGGVVRAPVAYDLGDAASFPFDTAGNPRFLFVCSASAGTDGVSNGSISRPLTPGSTTASGTLATAGHVFNGTAWDRQRGDVSATFMASSASATASVAMAPVVATSAFNLVVKASAGNFYGGSIVAGATAGFLIAYNATSAPANAAALTANLILGVVPVLANGAAAIGEYTIPDRFSAGIVLLFSTNLATYTQPANAAAFIRGRAA